MTCDPKELVRLAKCMECVPRSMRSAVKLWLLCQWAGASPARIQLSGADNPDVNQIYTLNQSTGVWEGANGLYRIVFVGENANILGLDNQTYYLSMPVDGNVFPYTWQPGDAGIDPSPTGIYI